MKASRATATAAPLVKFLLFAVVTILATTLLAATIVNISFAPEHTYRAVFSDVTSLEEGTTSASRECASARSKPSVSRTARWPR